VCLVLFASVCPHTSHPALAEPRHHIGRRQHAVSRWRGAEGGAAVQVMLCCPQRVCTGHLTAALLSQPHRRTSFPARARAPSAVGASRPPRAHLLHRNNRQPRRSLQDHVDPARPRQQSPLPPPPPSATNRMTQVTPSSSRRRPTPAHSPSSGRLALTSSACRLMRTACPRCCSRLTSRMLKPVGNN
jgi:hypothetical protein